MNLHDFYALYKKWFDKREKEDEVIEINRTTESSDKENINGRK